MKVVSNPAPLQLKVSSIIDSRYQHEQITWIWSKENKLNLWQRTELAVISAKEKLGLIEVGTHEKVSNILMGVPINTSWWKEREKQTRHDLVAFLDERLRHLPAQLQQYLHAGMTSYDTEEPAFVAMISDSMLVLQNFVEDLIVTLQKLAKRYRYTIMMGRTHGQEAQIQSFGKRCLTWLQAFCISANNLSGLMDNLTLSKLSGAIGNYGGLTPEIEKEALGIMHLRPMYGVTQIMPRELYTPIAQALCQLVLSLDKIANDVRLGARSGRPIYREPFGKKQTGSSAMPQKKNPISTEQMQGMDEMACGYAAAIQKNILTWEERAINQSCVERVAWPDLFHVAVHCANTMNQVLEMLQVYPDQMLMEIMDSRGCYATEKAKEFLRSRGEIFEIVSEDPYRIVQLAAFNAFEPEPWQKELREHPPESLEEIPLKLGPIKKQISIQEIIALGQLQVSEQLAASADDVQRWNIALLKMFGQDGISDTWSEVFNIRQCIERENKLYQEILGN